MKKFKVVTLGCKVNAYESEAISNMLIKEGFVRSEDKADVIVVNTCSVTSTSDSKSRQKIRHEINSNPGAIVCVMGCYSQVKANEVVNIDGVSIVIGTKYRDKMVELIKEFEKERKQIVLIEDSNTFRDFENLEVVDYFSNTRAYLKIEDGCNNFCSYCIIPYTRGRVRSKNKDLILKEAKRLVDNGYKEIVLTGIHTGAYGLDFVNYRFENLLEDLANVVQDKARIRISSIEIHELNDHVLKIMKEHKCFVNHFHIPLQAGSDTILKKMNRKYDLDYFSKRVQVIRENMEDCSLTTDVIVGFPGESEEEFKETMKTIQEIGFTKVHVFPFSSRSGTVASKMKEQVSGEVKKKRVNELISLSKRLGKEYYSKFLNKKREVLFETYDNESGMVSGYTGNYIKVRCVGDESLLNEFKEVIITDLIEKDNDYEMKGEIL